MDRLDQLASELSATLEELHREAQSRNMGELAVPLAWLDEANGWLRYELARIACPGQRDPVPFAYVPLDTRA